MMMMSFDGVSLMVVVMVVVVAGRVDWLVASIV